MTSSLSVSVSVSVVVLLIVVLVVITLVLVEVAASTGISPSAAAIFCTAAEVKAGLSTRLTSFNTAAVTRR